MKVPHQRSARTPHDAAATLLDASPANGAVVAPDPLVQPEVDIGMLADPLDLARMRDGARRLIGARAPVATTVAFVSPPFDDAVDLGPTDLR